MEKTYQPNEIEQRIYQKWEEEKRFVPGNDASADSYSIAIPPPNVTGSLHMGHAFQDAIMDALTRHQRMSGKNTLWQVGTDHAGIATQMVVERRLSAEGKTRHELGRKAFLDEIWKWKEESGGTITKQLRRLGASVDWDTERFTMDEGFTAAVQKVFVELYNEGLMYRGKRLVNWDPKLHTAISDLEVESIEKQGSMWHFRYPLANGKTTTDGKDYLVVATTRPETMLGDTAVAINPKDERYLHLVGEFIELPFTGRQIPIVKDDHVDRDFGTGCVKTTPAHDFNDYQIGQRHQLPMINIMNADGGILPVAEAYNSDGSHNADLCIELPAEFANLNREEAREAIVAAFEKADLLEKVEPHALKVPTGDRSGVTIEPLLTDQWFVDAKTLAKPAVQAVKDGDIKFVPQQYENMYNAWMDDIQDWCVSRQLWWGHRIPAWYDADGNIYVAESEEAVREKHNISASTPLMQDEDVLDTWFSSALWTFATLGWPEANERLARFHSTDVLVTGFDIIFFWVARMIMMTMHFVKDDDGKPQVPFKTVYVTGLIRDENGDKMSKSKGNVLDPLDMIDGIDLESLVTKRTGNMMQPKQAAKIEKNTRKAFADGITPHGTDALRFTLYSLASTGRDINWDMSRLEGYRNFCNKLWNAARYVLGNAEGEDCGVDGGEVELSIADRWIISRLQNTEQQISEAFGNYRFDNAARAAYEFVWNEYCDWYLELSKPVLYDDNASDAQKRGTRRTLVRVLEATLRMLHPLMPYITEEIWQQVKPFAGATGDTIMEAAYPVADPAKIDTDAEAELEWIKQFVLGLRQIRGEMDIAPSKLLPVTLQDATEQDTARLARNKPFLMGLAKLETLELQQGEPEASATALLGEMKILVPMAGLIDVSAEIERLSKQRQKLEKLQQSVEGKLKNERFVASAPEAVVAQERERAAGNAAAIEQLNQRISELESL